MLAAGPPVSGALWLRRTSGNAFGLGRFPEFSACEPPQYDITVGPFELPKCWQQLLGVARTERGRLTVDENRPVGEARRHRTIVPVEVTGRAAIRASAALESLQLLDQSCAFQVQQLCRLPFVAARALE